MPRRERLVDRVPPAVLARAITAPSAVLLAAGGASVAILAGAPLALAAAAGAAVWAGRVALGIPRRAAGERIDPGRLNDPWRSAVLDALGAQRRYDAAVAGCDAGPLRDRLDDISARVDDGVQECWRVARRGQALEQAVAGLDPGGLEHELAAAKQAGQDDAVHALQEALASSQRLASVATDARHRLATLNARLDEAVARAVELSLRAGEAGDLHGVGADVDAIVTELGSLREALDESRAAPASGPA